MLLADQSDRDRIANDLDTTLIVEAAAGTGKTTELVGRILRVLATGRAKVTEIVAVTFTEKAAGELKLRLRESLERARLDAIRSCSSGGESMAHPGSVTHGASSPAERDAVRARLDDALARLEEARVNTIHGFCADLLRERPVEARVDPLFTVLTESQSERLFDDAFSAWLQEQLEEPPEGVRRSLRRSAGLGFGPAGSGLGSAASGDDGPVDRLRRAGWALVGWRDFPAPWRRPDFDRPAEIEALLARLHAFADLSAHPSWDRDNLYQDTAAVRRLRDEIRRARSFGDVDYDGWEGALIDLCRDGFRSMRKGSGRVYAEGVPRTVVVDGRDALVEALGRFRALADADLAALLQRDLMGAVRRYEDLKARTGALDYLDLLLKARNLVRDDADVRRRLQSDFRCIFVDEFQDTDPLQAEILLLLGAGESAGSANWRSLSPVPGKLFIVGDPKQSIYRFRRADVGTYRQVCEHLEARGAVRLNLTTSFRGTPSMQRFVNAAFDPAMTDDPLTLQARYVSLSPYRADRRDQPTIVALPVPRPYATRRVAATAIEGSLPDAVGAFIDWLVNESGWKVAGRPGTRAKTGEGVVRARGFAPTEVEQWRDLEARDICVLFRRFVSWGEDITRPYVDAIEARGIPHLLVGGRSFHGREEVETLRAALTAVEWPDDELSVFATLKGALFAVGDEELLEYRYRYGRLHPFRLPTGLEEIRHPQSSNQSAISSPQSEMGNGARQITAALRLLRDLHIGRNRRPVADTVTRLLAATRAHVGFVLRPAGEQALANVLHVAELARQYELAGGISFRGFVEELQEAAGREQAAEAPILEEGSDGVRLMTVHKAKGLEFPVVILADMTAKLRPGEAGRWIDPGRGLCALRIGGCSPVDLLEHEAEESAREQAEAVRLAYVAATRARDLLVVPAVGDGPWDGGWLDPLNAALYPPSGSRREGRPAPGCPAFRSRDTVLERPDGDPAGVETVAPGLHDFTPQSAIDNPEINPHSALRHPKLGYSVVWWDPIVLHLDVDAPFGVRRDDLIVKDVSQTVVNAGLARYEDWRRRREDATAAGSRPSIAVRTATDLAADFDADPGGTRLQPGGSSDLPEVEIIELARDLHRPSGARYGTLVHAVLATVALDGDAATVGALAAVQGRIVGATGEEIASATGVVRAALAHPLLDRARAAMRVGRCRREVPVAWRGPDGALVEGVVDLAFEEDASWTVVDFKTDREIAAAGAHRYRQQLLQYAGAIRAVSGVAVRPVLVRL